MEHTLVRVFVPDMGTMCPLDVVEFGQVVVVAFRVYQIPCGASFPYEPHIVIMVVKAQFRYEDKRIRWNTVVFPVF